MKKGDLVFHPTKGIGYVGFDTDPSKYVISFKDRFVVDPYPDDHIVLDNKLIDIPLDKQPTVEFNGVYMILTYKAQRNASVLESVAVDGALLPEHRRSFEHLDEDNDVLFGTIRYDLTTFKLELIGFGVTYVLNKYHIVGHYPDIVKTGSRSPLIPRPYFKKNSFGFRKRGVPPVRSWLARPGILLDYDTQLSVLQFWNYKGQIRNLTYV